MAPLTSITNVQNVQCVGLIAVLAVSYVQSYGSWCKYTSSFWTLRKHCMPCLVSHDFQHAKSLGKTCLMDSPTAWRKARIRHGQCSLKFFKACVCIKYHLCNILPELIWIWNDVCEICVKYTFGEIFYMRSNVSCVRSLLVSQPVRARTA